MVPEKALLRSLPAILVLWIVGCGLASNFFLTMNHDVSYLLYLAGRMLRGAQLYVDLPEINPPLIVWLNLPAAWLALHFGWPDALVWRVLVSLLAAGALAASAAILRGGIGRAAWWLWLAVGAYVALALPAYEFGQREHLALLCTLPYLADAARRLEGAPAPLAQRGGVVLLATVGLAIKPHFVLVGLLVEAYAWRRSGRLSLALPLAAGLLLAYLLAAWRWAPHYLDMVRLLGRGYLAHEADWFSFLGAPYFQATAGLTLLALLAMPQRDPLARVLLLAIAGFALAALIQHKPWPYHWIPALSLACLLFGQALAQVAAPRPGASLAPGPLVALLALALLAGLALRMASGERYNPNPGVLGPAIRAHGGGPVIIFSRFAVSFPLVTEAGIGSSTRFPTMTIVQAMERSGDRAAVDWVRAAFASDFYRQPPRLLVLETDAGGQPLFDFIAYFAPQVPQLRAYRPVGQVGNFQLLQAPGAH